jgi:hypothetical protein
MGQDSAILDSTGQYTTRDINFLARVEYVLFRLVEKMGCCYSLPEEEPPAAVTIYSIAPAPSAPPLHPQPLPIAYAQAQYISQRHKPLYELQISAQQQAMYNQQIGYQVQQPQVAQKPEPVQKPELAQKPQPELAQQPLPYHTYPSAIPVL